MSGQYNPDWLSGDVQARVRERANHRCENCGCEFHHGTNLAKYDTNKKGRPIIGTCHHIDYDKSNDCPTNLVYLCQRCHLRIHGFGWKPGMKIQPFWEKPPLWIVHRNLPYWHQRTLFD